MKRVFVPGVFDVFHIGHLNYLKCASEAGDYLIVGVQDDRAVLDCKGVRPVIPLAERMAIIEELRFVDEVVSYVNVFQGPLLQGLEIDVLAVGEEYGEDDRYPIQRKTLRYCEEHGIEVARAPRTDHVSSTKIRGRLKEFWNARAQREDALPAGVTVLGSFQNDQQKVDDETTKEVELILQNVPNPSEKTLLDLGCGDGRQLVHLGEHFERVVGVDFAKDLLNIAQKRFDQAGSQAVLVEQDVTDFCVSEKFDVLLLSGITPCIDDSMLSKMLDNVGRMAKPNTILLLRSSIGLTQRVDVVNQFSEELGCRYTAYYRTAKEMVSIFHRHGWKIQQSQELYQHRKDTAVWWFEFSSTAITGGWEVEPVADLEPPRPGQSDRDRDAA